MSVIPAVSEAKARRLQVLAQSAQLSDLYKRPCVKKRHEVGQGVGAVAHSKVPGLIPAPLKQTKHNNLK